MAKKALDFFHLNSMTKTDVQIYSTITSIVGKQYEYNDCVHEVTHLTEYKPGYCVGIVETTKMKNIPPKKDNISKKVSGLDLNKTEGIAFANVFLYHKDLRILIYEMNKNGMYASKFIDFINNPDPATKNDITEDVVFTKNAYKKMMKMVTVKTFDFKITVPYGVKIEHLNETGPMGAIFKSCKGSDANTIECSLALSHERGKGLNLRDIISRTSALLKINKTGQNGVIVDKIEVMGYEKDPDNPNKTNRILLDMIMSKFRGTINLTDQKILVDLQITDRKTEIMKLFKKANPDLIEMYGNTEK